MGPLMGGGGTIDYNTINGINTSVNLQGLVPLNYDWQ